MTLMKLTLVDGTVAWVEIDSIIAVLGKDDEEEAQLMLSSGDKLTVRHSYDSVVCKLKDAHTVEIIPLD